MWLPLAVALGVLATGVAAVLFLLAGQETSQSPPRLQAPRLAGLGQSGRSGDQGPAEPVGSGLGGQAWVALLQQLEEFQQQARNIAPSSEATESAEQVGPAGPWDARLHLLSDELVQRHGARCLDGSPPGIYFRPASSPSAQHNWKIHFQGGGWCTSVADCLTRSSGALGSSKTWSLWLSTQLLPEGAGFYGLMDGNDTRTNPFGDWNFVWVGYCDGTSLTSDRAEPLVPPGQDQGPGALLHFRGRAILDAVLDAMESLGGFLSEAEEVVVSGTSAGGLATYLHAGHVKALLPPSARVVALPDAGFFLDHAAFGPRGALEPHRWRETLQEATGPLWNATLRGSAAKCLAEEPEAVNCFFPQYLYPYLNDVDGVFILQSLYDTASHGICFQLHCDLYTTCNATEAAAIQAYHLDLLAAIRAAHARFAKRDGYFLTGCYQHESSCRAQDWYGITIGGETPNSTFHRWYTAGASEESQLVDAPWPGDASCARISHGFC